MIVREIKNETKKITYKDYTLLVEELEYEITTGNDKYILLKYDDNMTFLKDLKNGLYKKLNREEAKLVFKHLRLTFQAMKPSSIPVGGSYDYLSEAATIESQESLTNLRKVLKEEL